MQGCESLKILWIFAFSFSFALTLSHHPANVLFSREWDFDFLLQFFKRQGIDSLNLFYFVVFFYLFCVPPCSLLLMSLLLENEISSFSHNVLIGGAMIP